jgi:hypothetical protein
MHSFCGKIHGSRIPKNPVFLLKEKNEEQSSFFAFTWEIGEYWHISILDGTMEL